MNNGHNEWVSIGDFMAGIIAVLVILLLVVIVQNTASSQNRDERKNRISSLLIDIKNKLPDELKEDIAIDTIKQLISLKKGTFRLGNPHPSNLMVQTLRNWNPKLQETLLIDPTLIILVEGHTDSLAVKESSKKMFKDNVELSLMRAQNSRNYLIERWPIHLKERVGISGWGKNRPIPNYIHIDTNRRVEIRFEFSVDSHVDTIMKKLDHLLKSK